MRPRFSRRHFIVVGLRAIVGLIFAHLAARLGQASPGPRLRARPGKPKQRTTPGRHAFGLGGSRDGFLSVPESYRPERQIPLILMLHGSHMQSANFTKFCESAAKESIAVAVPESRGLTWDGVRGVFGPDIEFLDRVLASVFDRLAVDQRRLAIAGFSDGASYSLSVGLSNGDLFSHVIAYSPEFLNAPTRYGKPPIFITHGARDPVLSVNSTERVVRGLQSSGYQVEFKEFSGGHFMPADLVKESFRWFLGGRG
ncbi:MAG: alpha/beta hydrolase [Chthoniobacterales bacterium]